MKKMILFISLLLSTVGLSQARLGYTYDQVRKEYANDYGFDYFTGYDEKLGKYLEVFLSIGTAFYYFNEENKCYVTSVIPNTKGDLHFYIQKFNDEYVIVDGNNWLMYTNGETIGIELDYTEDGYFFLFYYK